MKSDTILITGGATGIGFALARQLSERGNRVIICGRRKEALLKAQAEVPALITRVCDIADTESRQAMVAWLKTAYPNLNVVINNAAVQYSREFKAGGALENLDQEVATNLTAPIQLIGETLPLLVRQPRAVIINVSSGLAFVPAADVPVYSATKAAIHSFSLSLRHQLRTTCVRVVEMVPPIVDTDLRGKGRSESPVGLPIMSPEMFATIALAQLENRQEEILVGISVDARIQG